MNFKEKLKGVYSQQSKVFTDRYRDLLENAAKERKLSVIIELDNIEDLGSVVYTLREEEGLSVDWDRNCEITNNYNLKVYII